ncbi:MAG: hypothetical protein ACLRTQ_08610 [Candidatus Borkfalkia sp.]
MKHVGLNVACDPLFTSVYTGVNAGWSSPWRTIRPFSSERMIPARLRSARGSP